MNPINTDTTAPSTKSIICRGYEPIAGYKLEMLIGRGGFGEVWRSEAPGGLHKAVKFVYGSTHEQRAVRELRSLERIKGVHHPFLLTLERFGVVDDRLVIVTELAGGSLEDVYNRHLERGSCGIPRVSLLSYLHDAADALDYLHTNYQLQHLDIKPGNLLLIGGHAKVGDFGLLKDLHEAECSMVGGLSPVYAPPELFDGRPSLHSDQYSLAVMYQELLTGTRPFGGRTIAQLATQHVHCAPNLAPLPAADRPVLARALEKDPQRRFSNCCEFIDALRAAGSRLTRPMVGAGGSDRSDTLTGVLRKSIGVPVPAVRDLPQSKVSSNDRGVRVTSHALVIAVGGAGAQVLHLLRDRVATHRAACPLDLHSILIDTDSSTIQAARLAEVSDRVPVCQSLHTPLKSPQEYRSYKGQKYKSISRRWLCNIPRSCRTEAMRPLGRLALVDHGDAVMRQLKESVGHLFAVSGNAIPHVYLVGSMDGGTGSGMLLDLVHLVRHVLDEHQMAEVPLMPLFLTGPMHRDNSRALASSDAAAMLTEMNFYLNPGNGYPGDSAADWPSVPWARTPLVDAYMIASGLPNQAISDPVDTACEYIWVNSSPASDFLAAARQDAGDDSAVSAASSAKIRSIGIVRLRTPKLLEENLLAPSIVRQLLFNWLGDPAEAKELASDLASQMVKRCGLSVEAIKKHCCGDWAQDRQARVERLREAIGLLPWEVRNNSDELQESLQWLAEQTHGDSGEELVLNCMATLRRELSVRLSDTRCDLALAIEFLERLTKAIKQTAEEARTGNIEHVSFSVEATGPDAYSVAGLAERWLARVICCKIADVFDRVACSTAELLEGIHDRAAVLAQCVQLISLRLNGDDEEVWRYVDEGIRGQVESVLGTLRNKVSPSVVGIPSIVHDVGQVDCKELLQSLLDHALPLISNALTWGDDVDRNDAVVSSERQTTGAFDAPTVNGLERSVALNQGVSLVQEYATTTEFNTIGANAVGSNDDSRPMKKRGLRWDDPQIIAEAIRSVRPALLGCGGSQRMLLIVGSEAERLGLEPKIRVVHNGPLTSTVLPGAAAMLLCEAQQIRLTDVHSRLVSIAGNSECVMGRLAARNDIDWKTRTIPNP